MALIPNDPFRYLSEVLNEMNFSLFSGSNGAFSIRLDETEDQLIAICHVPGLKRKEEMEVELELGGRVLVVGRKTSGSYEMKGERVYKSKQFCGYYRQAIPLPSPVRGWSTTYSNEEVKIFMPKVK
ncbi:hypothetical protein [Ammoniphilus sp. 3BR4]|uniref:hypothetical protein n=1 Tax=Ammoniphilus sp. 3BR4 TaxID=3158265 RepID=UPI0034665547